MISLIVFAVLAIICLQVLTLFQQTIVIPILCIAMIFAFGMALGSGGDQARVSTGRDAPDYRVVAAKVGEIEREMKRIRLWQEKPLVPEKYNFTMAFAMDTMSYNQWLQFVFIPRVREIINTEGKFPASSSVGVQAVREFDTYPNAEGLITLLSEFDRLF